ncbi:MAG: DUF3169 family protein [Lachnospiraceae bacterium]|nr:DUF3169 family protein [Lachnospiraceae bacterium]
MNGEPVKSRRKRTWMFHFPRIRVTNRTCVILCMLTFVVMILFKTGIYPLACICVVWLVNTVSYMLTTVKLETTY